MGSKRRRAHHLVIAFLVGDFFQRFVSAAGADAWQALKTVTERGCATVKREYGSPETPASFMLIDGDGREVLFEEAMPEEAYRALFAIEWSEIEVEARSWLEWDSQSQEWRVRHWSPLPPP